MAPDALRQLELPQRPPAGRPPATAALRATLEGRPYHPVERGLLASFRRRPRLNLIALAVAAAVDLGLLAWLVGFATDSGHAPPRRTIRLVFMQAPPPPPPPPPPLAGRPQRTPEPQLRPVEIVQRPLARATPEPEPEPIEEVEPETELAGLGDDPAGIEGGTQG